MPAQDGKNLGRLTLSDGGRAGELRTQAEVELERAIRALFYAMRRRDGRLVSKNVANVTAGTTTPVRMLVRRLREAKGARNHQHNYPLAKQTVKELDRYVDRLFGRDTDRTEHTGEFRPAA